jgi:hypothetical protein
MSNLHTAWLLWSGLFSVIGTAVLVYGRRQRRGVPVIVGIALMVYPYFISNVWVLVGIGALLLAGLFYGSRLERGY